MRYDGAMCNVPWRHVWFTLSPLVRGTVRLRGGSVDSAPWCPEVGREDRQQRAWGPEGSGMWRSHLIGYDTPYVNGPQHVA